LDVWISVLQKSKHPKRRRAAALQKSKAASRTTSCLQKETYGPQEEGR
jgi:hypothetical protein